MFKQNFRLQRNRDLNKIGKWIIGLIVIPIILQAIYTDIKIVGYNPLWIALRVGIVPIGLIGIALYKAEFFKRYPSLPILFVAFYVAGIHLLFVAETGYSKSHYFHSYVQLLMGFTILPFAWITYLTGTSLILFGYVAVVLYGSGFDMAVLSQDNAIFLKTYVIIAYATFFFMDKVRCKFYEKENELELEIDKRQMIIDFKAKELSKTRVRLVQQEANSARLKSLGKMAAQVAHNIRSPVGTIDVIIKSTPELPPAARGPLESAVSEIRNVASKLLRAKNHDPDHEIADLVVLPLSKLVSNVVKDKNLLYSRYKGLRLSTNADDLDPAEFYVKVDPTDFTGALKNLVHNAFEALGGSGAISVSVSKNRNSVFVSVKDNGRGIPADILRIISKGQTGISFMKPNGSGLGIPHAKSSVEAWDGSFDIRSSETNGTEVTLTIPLVDHLRVDSIIEKPLQSSVARDTRNR